MIRFPVKNLRGNLPIAFTFMNAMQQLGHEFIFIPRNGGDG
jgi:hypothetical protein